MCSDYQSSGSGWKPYRKELYRRMENRAHRCLRNRVKVNWGSWRVTEELGTTYSMACRAKGSHSSRMQRPGGHASLPTLWSITLPWSEWGRNISSPLVRYCSAQPQCEAMRSEKSVYSAGTQRGHPYHLAPPYIPSTPASVSSTKNLTCRCVSSGW